MNRKYSSLLILLLISFAFATPTFAAGETSKESKQTICPVMAGNIDKNIYADYNGKRIYFCCSGCLDEFKKNPEKYIKEMEAKGIKLDKTP
jgi:YHS domain-containing protein